MSTLTELLALVNTANGTNYDASHVAFAAPAVVDHNGKNTSIVVTGKAGGGRTGSKTLYYTRLDLAQQFTGHPLTSSGPATGGTLAEVLADIATATGVSIDAGDLSNAADVDFSAGTVTLTAKADSLKWVGSVVVTLTTDAIDINSELTVDELAGFNYATIS